LAQNLGREAKMKIFFFCPPAILMTQPHGAQPFDDARGAETDMGPPDPKSPGGIGDFDRLKSNSIIPFHQLLHGAGFQIQPALQQLSPSITPSPTTIHPERA
jgi:hypothetical protein